jgi:hypothetical protein
MVPKFRTDGLLPEGIIEANWEEIVNRFGFNQHRITLLKGLKAALQNLKLAGCEAVYLDGSFVTNKEFPNDYDACWDTSNVDPNKLDPVFLNFSNRRFAQKLKYQGEFFPSSFIANPKGDVYIDFFQTDKNSGEKKGIVLIKLKEF